MPSIIDIDAEWLQQMMVFDHSSDTGKYWDRRSVTFQDGTRVSSYAGDLLSRMKLSPEDSVLDVACGTGIVSVPLSKMVRRVTALDISASMLERLRFAINEENIANITLVHNNWNHVSVGKDIMPHDIVLVSRSLPNILLSETLRRVNQAAQKACYITWRADRINPYEISLGEALGRTPKPFPDYRLIAAMLESMGIARKSIFLSLSARKNTPVPEESVKYMSRGKELNDDQFRKLLSMAEARLTFQDGYYEASNTQKWALISWEK